MTKKIFIDPGHGGSDPGAVGNGLKEKDLTLAIALECRRVLANEYTGHLIKMSRTSDKTVSLKQRTDMANAWGADFFLSIHINAGGGTGFESYRWVQKGSSTTMAVQKAVHAAVLKVSGWRDRGQKWANFHVLRESNPPAILTENGFIDTAADAKKLKDSAFIKKLGRAHAEGLAKALGLKKKATAPKPAPTPPSSAAKYRVQAGAFKEKKNADKRMAELKKKGFESFAVKEGSLYRVQAGAFKEKKNAEARASAIRKAGFEAVVVAI